MIGRHENDLWFMFEVNMMDKLNNPNPKKTVNERDSEADPIGVKEHIKDTVELLKK